MITHKGLFIAQERPSTRGFVKVQVLGDKLFRGVDALSSRLIHECEVQIDLKPVEDCEEQDRGCEVRRRVGIRKEGSQWVQKKSFQPIKKQRVKQTSEQLKREKQRELQYKAATGDKCQKTSTEYQSIFQGQEHDSNQGRQAGGDLHQARAAEQKEDSLSFSESDSCLAAEVKYRVIEVRPLNNPLQNRYFCARITVEPRQKPLCRRKDLENSLEWFCRQYFVDLRPRNKRLPKMKPVSFEGASRAILKEIKEEQDHWSEEQAVLRVLERGLFKCRWEGWAGRYPQASVEGYIGVNGFLESELFAVLTQLSLDFPKLKAPRLRPLDLSTRTLLPGFVFSIDPEESIDLDDALSICPAGPGAFELGVHIAGMCSVLDMVDWLDMTTRTSTLYFPHRADHLLPRPVVDLATLNTSGPKSTLSAFINIDQHGQLIPSRPTRFVRGQVRSMCRLSYQVAQQIIDGRIRCFQDMPLAFRVIDPELFDQLQCQVRILNRLMQARFRERVAAGYVVNVRSQLKWKVDADGLPLSFDFYERTEAHRLVEEAMIMANGEAARFLVSNAPQAALRIHHPPPRELDMQKLNTQLNAIQTAPQLRLDPAAPLPKLELAGHQDYSRLQGLLRQHMRPHVSLAVQWLWIKCQSPAQYVLGADPRLSHFALMTDSYTHFTSPMRRMADDFVHLALEAVLEHKQPVPPAEVELAALNRVRRACKQLKVKMDQLFLGLLVVERGKSVPTTGIVMELAGREVTIFLHLINGIRRVDIKAYYGVQNYYRAQTYEAKKNKKKRRKGKKAESSEGSTAELTAETRAKIQAKPLPGYVLQHYDQDDRSRLLQIQKFEELEVRIVVLSEVELSLDLRVRARGGGRVWLQAKKPRRFV